MRHLSKLVYVLFFVVFLLATYFVLHTTNVVAQVPELLLPCTETANNEFHSLRPYQAAPCGPSPQALFCSNKLVIFENFQLKGECSKTGCEECDFTCYPNYQVEGHNLNITLDESEFPIMGNTQDEFDDATKLNEYASWYLSGVNDKRENKDATDDQIINFSGPVKKLLPEMIQDAQRIKIIKSPKTITVNEELVLPLLEVDDNLNGQPDNHDQLVIDDKRLSFWAEGSLSAVRSATNFLNNGVGVATYLGSQLNNLITGNQNTVDVNFNDAWNKCYPPLPWDDGTIESFEGNVTTNETIQNPKPFESELLYKKAYNEWLGKSCAILPVVGLVCVDLRVGTLDVISNECSDLWHYVPLSNNSDKKGKNYLLTGDGPNYVPSLGTEIDNAQHLSYRNAPLYFAHTQEVFDLSEILNKTYQPAEFESVPLPETTEKIKKGIKENKTSAGNDPKTELTGEKDNQQNAKKDPYATLDCSAINVRINEGDDLFPGDRPDNKELFVEKAQYLITEVQCHEENKKIIEIDEDTGKEIVRWHRVFTCPAQVGIEFKTGTQTPYANEIFSETVADSGSTFRKIFPRVEKGAPVECIADIPTQTGVTYELDPNLTEPPNGGDQELRQKAYPADGASDETMLTFPHIGSVYEYFLQGIQTALRPKGYGSPIANGNCKPTEPVECGEWEEKLEGSGGACGICNAPIGNLAKKILTAAGTAYNVPAANIWAAMKHEGADGYQGTTYDFSDENVKKWSNSVECGGEPMPACDNSVDSTQPPFGFLSKWFYLGDGDNALWTAVQKIDPSRDSPDKVSRCNFLDAAFATAKLLRQGSSNTSTSAGISCGIRNFDTTQPASCSDWTDTKIAQSQVGHMGQCPETSPYGPVPFKIEDVVNWYKSAKCN